MTRYLSYRDIERDLQGSVSSVFISLYFIQATERKCKPLRDQITDTFWHVPEPDTKALVGTGPSQARTSSRHFR